MLRVLETRARSGKKPDLFLSHVTEEDFETNEGDTEDLYDKLMEMTGWNVTWSSVRLYF
jgi:hypothetical protein